ncbi:MAG: hypothetical protein JWN63_1202 [Candidatus Acidoferrum typicum]|jgi:hypothetical protein|nr:hypothetical protein [Candidatus Acidoferrum typicum]
MTKLDQESKTMLPRVGWVLYDGGCGFCFRWVHFWERVIERRGFSLKDLQSAWEDGSLKKSQQNLLDDILSIDPGWQVGIWGRCVSLCSTENLVGMAILRNLSPTRF